MRTASAVEGAAACCTSGSRSRSVCEHCASACGCESTRVIASRATPSLAISECWIGRTTSATISTPPRSSASMSTVAVTEPSSEFSIGTTQAV